MLKTNICHSKKQYQIKNSYIYVVILLFFSFLKITHSQEVSTNLEICEGNPSLGQCNIIIFNHKKYQANNFAINKNGDLVLELTEFTEYGELLSSRLFYGLTKDGRYLFSNKTSYIQELDISIDEDSFDEYDYFNYYKIYNPINAFVSIKNDPNKGNEYLFSINSYNTLIELHDFNNDNRYNRTDTRANQKRHNICK